MDAEMIRAYCLQKKGVTESFPFDESKLVFKVMDKIFLLMDLYAPQISVNLKCDPDRAIELRERYDSVRPGYHMNKKLWNTVTCTGEFSDAEFWAMIDHSYDEVVKKLTRKTRAELAEMT